MRKSTGLLWRLYSVGDIKLKTMGIVFALAMLLSGTLIYQASSVLESTGRDQLRGQAVSLANYVATRSADLILTHNLYALRELLRDTVSHNPDLRYVVIYGPDGQVIDSTFGREIPVALLTARQPNPGRDPVTFDAGDEQIYDAAAPIFDGEAGTVRVGVTDRQLMADIWRTIRKMLAETGAITLGALIAAYLLTVVLTRPIADLVTATRAVGGGDLARRARQYANDEVGQLASAFNQMTENLQLSREQLLRRNRDLTVLNRVAEAVTRPMEKEQMLREIMDGVQSALGLDRICIFRSESSQGADPLFCTAGDRLPHCFAPPEFRAAVARDGQPRVLEAGGVVPLVAEGRVTGVLCYHHKAGRPGAAIEPKLLEALGRQVGIAMENIRLWEELKAKEAVRAELVSKLISAQEEERKRIALELHDQSGQSMTSMMVGLKLLENSSTLVQAKERIAELRAIASTVLEELHSLALWLRPPVLDQLGLIHALDRYTQEFSRKYGIQVDLEADGFADRKLPVYVGTTLYRITQEALTNVARHASARHVNLSYTWLDGRITAIIHDDGRGFDTSEAMSRQRERLGLFGMQERARLAGGWLEVRSAPGSGTTILIKVPVTEPAQSQAGGESLAAQSASGARR